MKFEDIKHGSTKKAVINYSINLDDYETYEELREYLKHNRMRLYRIHNKEYYQNYMKKRYIDNKVSPKKTM